MKIIKIIILIMIGIYIGSYIGKENVDKGVNITIKGIKSSYVWVKDKYENKDKKIILFSSNRIY